MNETKHQQNLQMVKTCNCCNKFKFVKDTIYIQIVYLTLYHEAHISNSEIH